MMTKNADKKREQMMMFSMDDMVPQNHMLRLIDKAINWNFIYDLVEEKYCPDNGRPSMDPVMLIKIPFIQYLYGIKSMRQTIKEIEVNVTYRWFLGLDMLDPVPHFSTFGKNYTRRFKDTDLFEQIFSKILEDCMKYKLVNKEAFRKDIWFEVSEFMLLPENLTDKNGRLLNPAVGESINLANLKVKLVQYINGKGDPVEITGNDIKIVVMSWKDTESGKLQYDYDDEAWNMQEVSGQELPIMTRKSDDNTRLALSAMRKNKNGEWERLVRKHFEIGENSSKHSHSWKAVKTVQATCTSKGSRTDKCTSCDGVRTVTLPAKHTVVKDAAVVATVFKAGKKEGSHCKVCGKVLRKQTTVAKLKPTISLTASSLKLKTGQSTTAFKAAGLARGDYVTKVTSGNTGIVKVFSVTKRGTFRLTAGKKAGSTTVKVILASKKSASFKVTVQRGAVKTSKITVSTKSVTLKKGTTYRKLASSVKVTPVTSQEKVTYTSSNKKIATVTPGGVIKGLKKGTATITIRSGSKKTTCKVTVK